MENEIKDYVLLGIRGFVMDPPDSDYQRGYLSALLEIARQMKLGGVTLEGVVMPQDGLQ